MTQEVQAVGAAPGTCATVGGFSAKFTVSGGVSPYTFSTSQLNGGTIDPNGNFFIPAFGPLAGGTSAGEMVTVRDALGNTATATVTITCKAST